MGGNISEFEGEVNSSRKSNKVFKTEERERETVCVCMCLYVCV